MFKKLFGGGQYYKNIICLFSMFLMANLLLAGWGGGGNGLPLTGGTLTGDLNSGYKIIGSTMGNTNTKLYGDGSSLSALVKKAGDTMSGLLTINTGGTYSLDLYDNINMNNNGIWNANKISGTNTPQIDFNTETHTLQINDAGSGVTGYPFEVYRPTLFDLSNRKLSSTNNYQFQIKGYTGITVFAVENIEPSLPLLRFGGSSANFGNIPINNISTITVTGQYIMKDGTVITSSTNFLGTTQRPYAYTLLLKEVSSSGSDTTTSSIWEDKLGIVGKWNKWIDSSTIVSATAYTYMRLASSDTASTVSGLTGVKVGGTWYYSTQRDTETATSSTYQDFPETIDIPVSAFETGLNTNLDIKMRTKSDTNQNVYYYFERAYLVVKTKE